MEVLIAVVLLLAIAALLWPDFTSLGVRATRNAAGDSLQAACDVARSRAMSQLIPVRLVATKRADGWSLDAGAVPRVLNEDGAGRFEDQDPDEMPVLVRVGELPPNVSAISQGDNAGLRQDSAAVFRSEGASDPSHIELLVVLPDGSVQASSAMLLHRGERAPFSVQRWTGRITIGDWLVEESDETDVNDRMEEPERPPSDLTTARPDVPMEDGEP